MIEESKIARDAGRIVTLTFKTPRFLVIADSVAAITS
jgi:hypothetical protein